ncbi:hypothetical protein MTO96_027842, partial [Rhipicephalus appendiculatus]
TQQYLNNQSIMISINVRNVTLNKTLEVNTSKTILNGSATLKSLQNYSETYSLTNDSVVFLFTNKSINVEDNAGSPFPANTLSTFGTFCSSNRSAAIVVQRPGNPSYLYTLKATVEVLGSKNFYTFKREDIDKMEKIFSHCHINKTEVAEESEED